MSSVELVITPKEKDLGDNFVVRRSLPDHRKKMVGPFIFWDHMGPVTLVDEKNMTVRSHPHIGLATITWLFSGKILHRDSLGNEQMIRPGEVNWMTAGSGIAHSERSNPEGDESYKLEGIQLWLALPVEHEDVQASFFHCKEKDIPQIKKDGINLRLVAGEAWGEKSPVPVYSSLFYLNGEVEKDGHYQQIIKTSEEGAIYVVDGEIEVEGKTYGDYQLIIFKKGQAIQFKATKNSKVMVFGGEVFPERRYIWWNFVSHDKEKIEKAKEDWKQGRFAPVINETERIPLPLY